MLNFDLYSDQPKKPHIGAAKHFIAITLGMLIVLFNLQTSLAAESKPVEKEEPRWFEVEVILYKANSELGLTNESWSTDTKLKLPVPIIDFLQPYSQPEEFELDNILTTDTTPISTDSNFSANSDTAERFKLAKTQSSEDILAGEQIELFEDEIELEKPFVLLADSYLQLNTEAQRVSKNRNYTLLSHFSWRQPVLGRRDSQPIRIAGGTDFQESFRYSGTEKIKYSISETPEQKAQSDSDVENTLQLDATATVAPDTETNNSLDSRIVDEQEILFESEQEFVPVAIPWVPEIDGSMLVYIQRNYLHIDANLFYRRPDKEQLTRVDLTKSVLISSNNLYLTDEIGDNSFFKTGAINPPITSERLASNQTNQTSNYSDINDPAQINDNQSIAYQDDSLGWQFDENFLLRESEKIYITRLFNYPLNQTRRLRSGELHYFDHPLIGMLVMIRSYQRFPEEESELIDSQVVNSN